MSDLMQTIWIVWDINKQIITVKMSYMSCFVDIMKEYFEDGTFLLEEQNKGGKGIFVKMLNMDYCI